MLRSLEQFVRLTDEDREAARDCANRMMGDVGDKRDRFGSPSYQSHFYGALGEIAFSRFVGVPWACHLGDIGGRPDVCLEGTCYEVRAVSPTAKYAELKAKPNDPPDRRLVLVLLHGPAQIDVAGGIVAGWMTAAEVKRHGKRADPRGRGAPAYFMADLSKLHQDGWV